MTIIKIIRIAVMIMIIVYSLQFLIPINLFYYNMSAGIKSRIEGKCLSIKHFLIHSIAIIIVTIMGCI